MIDKSVIDRAIESQGWIEPVSETLQNVVGGFLRSGPATRAVKNFLHGVWFGHPLHPAVVDIPVGMWTAAMVLDTLGEASDSDGLRKAADASVAVGIAGAVGAAATGLADWSDTFGRPRSLGLVHATLNTAALGLYTGSLLARLAGARRAGVGLAVTGYAVATAASYLGGEIVFHTGQGVNRNAWLVGAGEFTPVVALDEWADDQPKKGEV